MERVTKREKIAGHNVAYVLGEDCFDVGSVPKKFMGNAIDRLAAYEETGLEPEDITRVFNEDSVLKLTSQILQITPDRLRELAKADRDGRCAILSDPMKPMVNKPNDTDVYCPNCGKTLSGGWELSDADDTRKLCQCPKCGQSIDDTKCEVAISDE